MQQQQRQQQQQQHDHHHQHRRHHHHHHAAAASTSTSTPAVSVGCFRIRGWLNMHARTQAHMRQAKRGNENGVGASNTRAEGRSTKSYTERQTQKTEEHDRDRVRESETGTRTDLRHCCKCVGEGRDCSGRLELGLAPARSSMKAPHTSAIAQRELGAGPMMSHHPHHPPQRCGNQSHFNRQKSNKNQRRRKSSTK
jgi:hypothetical protein